MINLFSILFFIIVFLLLGWTLLYLLKLNLRQVFIERYFLCLGVGLGIFPLLAVILNLLHVPLVWWLFLIISLIVPIIYLCKSKLKYKLTFKKIFGSWQLFVMLLIFFIVFFVMVKGAFVYPYLEDDDPWAHALAAKYVAVEKNLNPESQVLHYLNPYPPAYSALMGILHQTNNSIYWTLKFFNALIVALTIPFFYLFAKLIFRNRNKALFSTFILASLPCFLSHFIWAHSFVILLMLIAFYWMLRYKEKRVLFIFSLLIAGIFFTQITQAMKFGIIFFAFFIISSLVRKRFNFKLFLIGSGGVLLSLFWWFSRGLEFFVRYQERAIVNKGRIFATNSGTSSRAYNLKEFLFPVKFNNLMTNPVGIGWVVCLLAVIGIIAVLIVLIFNYKNLTLRKKEYYFFILFFGIFTFLGVNSVTFNLPVGLFAFRFWMLIAIPIALLSSYGLWFLFEYLPKIDAIKKLECPKSIILFIILVLIIIGISITSAYSKIHLNTDLWGPGHSLWDSHKEIYEFIKLRESPNQKMFPACKEGFKKLLGNDQFACAWCKDELEFQQNIFDKSSLEISFFLRKHYYQHLVIDSTCLQSYPETKMGLKVKELLESGLFKQNKKNSYILDVHK